jgi:cob(I)alamin adenosyltransferase
MEMENSKTKEKTVAPAKGLVIINTGNGKGKTTAALGLMMRAWGNDMSVVMLQFIKSPENGSGEYRAAKRIGIEILQGGAGFVFDPQDANVHRTLAIKQWQEAQKRINSGKYDLVVLDELTYPLKFGWIAVGEVIDVLEHRPSNLHVVITGREAPRALIDFADTVVNVGDVKHHFKKGIKAQAGIEL